MTAGVNGSGLYTPDSYFYSNQPGGIGAVQILYCTYTTGTYTNLTVGSTVSGSYMFTVSSSYAGPWSWAGILNSVPAAYYMTSGDRRNSTTSWTIGTVTFTNAGYGGTWKFMGSGHSTLWQYIDPKAGNTTVLWPALFTRIS